MCNINNHLSFSLLLDTLLFCHIANCMSYQTEQHLKITNSSNVYHTVITTEHYIDRKFLQ